jgi:hypothetical protein
MRATRTLPAFRACLLVWRVRTEATEGTEETVEPQRNGATETNGEDSDCGCNGGPGENGGPPLYRYLAGRMAGQVFAVFSHNEPAGAA